MKKNLTRPEANSSAGTRRLSFAAICRPTLVAAALAAGALFASTSLAVASPLYFVANTTPLNNSGVYGTFDLTLNGNLLTVTEHATGLEPGMLHVQHIHGMLPPNQASTRTANASDDTNHDGYVDLAEGAVAYGPILLDLSSPPGGGAGSFPTAPNGVINFSQTYDLTNPADYGTPFDEADLLPGGPMSLTQREIVIHGMTVGPNYMPSSAAADCGTPGTTHYCATLPVSDGKIMSATSVPEPGSFALLGTALVGFGLVGWCYKKRRAA